MVIVQNLQESPFIVYGVLNLHRELVGAGITEDPSVGLTFARLAEQGIISYSYHRVTVLYRADTLCQAARLRKKAGVPHYPTLTTPRLRPPIPKKTKKKITKH